MKENIFSRSEFCSVLRNIPRCWVAPAQVFRSWGGPIRGSALQYVFLQVLPARIWNQSSCPCNFLLSLRRPLQIHYLVEFPRHHSLQFCSLKTCIILGPFPPLVLQGDKAIGKDSKEVWGVSFIKATHSLTSFHCQRSIHPETALRVLAQQVTLILRRSWPIHILISWLRHTTLEDL